MPIGGDTHDYEREAVTRERDALRAVIRSWASVMWHAGRCVSLPPAMADKLNAVPLEHRLNVTQPLDLDALDAALLRLGGRRW